MTRRAGDLADGRSGRPLDNVSLRRALYRQPIYRHPVYHVARV